MLKVLSLTLCLCTATEMLLSGSFFSVLTQWGRYVWRTFDEEWYFDSLHVKAYVMDMSGNIERCVCVSLSWSPRLETTYLYTRTWEAAPYREHIHVKNKRVISNWVLQVDTGDCVNEFVSRTADRAVYCCWHVCERMLGSTLFRYVLLTSTGPNEVC